MRDVFELLCKTFCLYDIHDFIKCRSTYIKNGIIKFPKIRTIVLKKKNSEGSLLNARGLTIDPFRVDPLK